MSTTYITEDSARVSNIVLLSITILIGTARLSLSVYSNHAFRPEDYWFLAASLFYITLCALYLNINHLLFTVTGIQDGTVRPWPTFLHDISWMLKRLFACTTLLFLILWAVKFSILAFYRQLLSRVRGYVRWWWTVVVFTILSLIATLLTHIFSCGIDVSNEWHGDKCIDDASTRRSFASLWTNYALDVATDFAIMGLPLDMILKAQMPLQKKLVVGGMFSLATICVVFATIRVKEVGSTASITHLPSISWLEVWAIVESSVAIWVGAAPGIYRASQNIRRSRAVNSEGYRSSDHGGSRSGKRSHMRTHDIELAHRGRSYACKATVHSHGRGSPTDDAGSSQEKLTKHAAYTNNGIAVTKSTSVANDRERDDNAFGETMIENDQW